MVQIAFKDVDLAFGNNTVVEGFNLNIDEGEIVTFFGPSGCGKSSIMKMVLGINNPSRGQVMIKNIDAKNYASPISYVPQGNELLPWLSVKENVEIWSSTVAAPYLSTREVLTLVDMYAHADKLPGILSGGMSRRTALARGLATASDILCFDEALVGIEKTMRHSLLFNLRSHINKHKITAIFISHDYEETILLSDRIVILTPPPTVISRVIEVRHLLAETKRDTDFIHSSTFKDIYNQMLIT